MDDGLEQCRRAATSLIDIGKRNQEALEKYNKDHKSWADKRTVWNNDYMGRRGKWAQYPATAPDEFVTACIVNAEPADGTSHCQRYAQEQKKAGVPKFWYAAWDNCEACDNASLACNGLFGHDKQKKFGCRYKFKESEDEWTRNAPPFPGDEPTYNPEPTGGVIICQKCVNQVTAIANNNADLAASQVLKCIANVSGTSESVNNGDQENKDEGNNKDTSVDDPTLWYALAGILALLCLGMMCFLCISSAGVSIFAISQD